QTRAHGGVGLADAARAVTPPRVSHHRNRPTPRSHAHGAEGHAANREPDPHKPGGAAWVRLAKQPRRVAPDRRWHCGTHCAWWAAAGGKSAGPAASDAATTLRSGRARVPAVRLSNSAITSANPPQGVIA